MITPNRFDNYAFAVVEMVCASSCSQIAHHIASISACYVSFLLYFRC